MQVQQYKSLLWLSRWHNERSLRLWHQLQHHHCVLTQLVLAELNGRAPDSPVELTLCGLHILCDVQNGQVRLYSISPPEDSTGIQRSLFTLSGKPRERERVIQFRPPQRRSRLRLLPPPVTPDTRRGT
jgi:hypothetical protein